MFNVKTRRSQLGCMLLLAGRVFWVGTGFLMLAFNLAVLLLDFPRDAALHFLVRVIEVVRLPATILARVINTVNNGIR